MQVCMTSASRIMHLITATVCAVGWLLSLLCKTASAVPQVPYSSLQLHIIKHLFSLFLSYILAHLNVISEREPTYDSAHSWQCHNAAPLADQAASTRTRYPTQPYYPEIVLTNPYPILLMPSMKLGSDKYHVIALTHLEFALLTSQMGTLRSAHVASASGSLKWSLIEAILKLCRCKY